MSESMMDIWIYDGKFPLLLSVNPGELMLSSPSNPEVLEVINLGQVTELTTPELVTFSIKSFWTDHWEYPYIQDKSRWYAQEEFVKRIEDARKEKKPVTFMIADTTLDLDMEVVIEDFQYGYKAGSMDLEYELQFRQYRKAQAKFLQQVNKTIYTQQPARPANAGGDVAVGSTVVVNGQLHRDSSGGGPGQMESNATRKISHMNNGAKCPIHITTLEGGWRGWVTKESVKLA